MTRNYKLFLEDIINSIINIEEFTKGFSYESFSKDKKTQSAVIRELEIIGEASKNIPKEIEEKFPEIPWSDMSRMRDKLIHGYFSINLEILWKTVKERIPEIKPKIEKLFKS